MTEETFKIGDVVEVINTAMFDSRTKIIKFIERLAWHDVEFDALMSGIDVVGSRLAIPRYSKKYFALWKEMFNEDLQEKAVQNERNFI